MSANMVLANEMKEEMCYNEKLYCMSRFSFKNRAQSKLKRNGTNELYSL